MLDLSNLLRFLPVSHLEPETIGWISGLTEEVPGRWQLPDIALLEPPVGQAVPYVDPVRTMTSIFRAQGDVPEEAAPRARAEYAALRPHLELIERVRFLPFCDPNSPEYVPFPRLFESLESRRLIRQPLTDFLTRVGDATDSAALFLNPEQPETRWTLASLPDQPPAKAMIEFIPGPPWRCDLDTPEGMAAFADWHRHLRPIVERLEQALGQTVYAFHDLDDDYGDDYGHRFLVLYCCCRSYPESSYVRFLVEASGAGDVETLKAALIAPENYRQPFEMNYTSCDDFGTLPLRFHYLKPGERRVVGLVFLTLAARAIAEHILLQLVGADVWIIAPKRLVPDDWLATATRHCNDWVHQYVYDEQIAEPISLLARLDELWVISSISGWRGGNDLGLSPSAEELLWLAQTVELPAHFLFADGIGLGNPDYSLKQSGVPARAAELARRREAYSRKLVDIVLDNDYCSSGLWVAGGGMVSYDNLAIPFELVRRIAAWQDDFDANNDPPATADDAWWERHDQKAATIASSLHKALSGRVTIRYHQNSQWRTLDGSEA